ncbi:MAG: NADAR family protein, partial [Cyanobacteria bacterium P01_H01_bin.130]
RSMVIYFYKLSGPYGCFSNFSPHWVDLKGDYWPTSEHFYQAQKFVGSPDEALITKIRRAATPAKAAALGRDPNHRMRSDWDHVKQGVMYQVVREKFRRHRDIQDVLLGTGEERLIEDSPTDYYWGCGATGDGQNHLGRILMAIREELRQGSKRDSRLVLSAATGLPKGAFE